MGCKYRVRNLVTNLSLMNIANHDWHNKSFYTENVCPFIKKDLGNYILKVIFYLLKEKL
jgi:hypothetical protein